MEDSDAPADPFLAEIATKRAIAEQRDLGANAICKIKYGVRYSSQTKNRPFVLQDWATRFQETLGPYKKFLLSRPDQFKIIEGASPEEFTIELVPQMLVYPPEKGKGKGKGKGKFKGKGKGKGKINEKGKFADKGKGSAKGEGKGSSGGVPFFRAGGKGSAWSGSVVVPAGAQPGALRATAPPPAFAGEKFAIRVAAAKAVAEIRSGLASAPGGTFMPSDWEARYGATLGGYKAFLLRIPSHFTVVEFGGSADNFRVELAAPGAAVKPDKQQTRGAQLLAEAAREALAAELEEEVEAEQGNDDGLDDLDRWAASMADVEVEEPTEEPMSGAKEDAGSHQAETASKHGNLIASLLGDGPLGSSNGPFLGAKRARLG